MLDPNTGLIIGACGLGIVCLGLVAAMMFVVLRLTGRGYMEFLSIFVPNKEDKDEPSYIARSRPDLRHIVKQSADFESAIAKNVVNNDLRPTEPPPSIIPAQSAPSPLPRGLSSGTPVPFGPGTPPSFTPPSFNDEPTAPPEEGLPPATPRLRNVDPLNRPRKNRVNDNYSQDEIFGGILDDDGDGQIDDYQ